MEGEKRNCEIEKAWKREFKYQNVETRIIDVNMKRKRSEARNNIK